MNVAQVLACIGFGGLMSLFFIGFGMALQRKIDGTDEVMKDDSRKELNGDADN